MTGVGRSKGAARPRDAPRRQLLVFCVVAVAVFAVVAVGAVLGCRSVARSQAFDDAERMTSRMADYVVGPLLPDALTPPGVVQRAQLDRAIRDRVADGYLFEAMVWNAQGRIVWASDPKIIGAVAPTPAEATAAITSGTISAGFSQRPEVTHPGQILPTEGFVEVDAPLPGSAHSGLAFQAYYNYARVNDLADQLTRQMLPLALLPLLLLQLIQVPIAFSLTRRVRRQDVQRNVLLEQHLLISDRERVRIAADLHDGPIQDLSGIGYALCAIAPAVPQQHQQLMTNAQDAVHRSTQSLRRMTVDLYPPDLRADQLPATLEGLAAPLRRLGIEVDITVDPLPDLAAEVVQALYRIAREALANVAQHAHATAVHVALRSNNSDQQHRTVELAISDNGVGLDLRALERRKQGHLGLPLLIDRARNLGGYLTVLTADGSGTDLRAVIPVNQPRPAARAAVAIRG